jgi:DNA mismatch endonuclease (patch repair protein)
MDIFDRQKRSDVMSRVRGKDTKPELRVRSHLHAAGLRYLLHDKRLPGKPDLSFPSRRVAVFVHGCFWHGHEGCKRATLPATRPEFWQVKIDGNRKRDQRDREALAALGWQVRIIWQCSITDAVLGDLAREIAGLPPMTRAIRRRSPMISGKFSRPMASKGENGAG